MTDLGKETGIPADAGNQQPTTDMDASNQTAPEAAAQDNSEETKVVDKNQKLEMTQEQFDQAIKESASEAAAQAAKIIMDKQLHGDENDDDVEMKRTVRIKLIGKKPVKSRSKAYDIKDSSDPKNRITMIKLTTIDDKVHEMTLEKWMSDEIEVITCELVERKEEVKMVTRERAMVFPQSSDGYFMVAGGANGISVPLKVGTVKTTYMVRLPNDEVVELNIVN